MNGDLKRKLDDLNELLSQNYITDSEYAIARENVLADSGIDIVPRMEAPIVRDSVRPFRARREQHNSGCGCFLVLLLILVAAAGCFLALPEDIAKKIPGVGSLIDEPRYQEIRQTITQFIDDQKQTRTGTGARAGTGTGTQTQAEASHVELRLHSDARSGQDSFDGFL